MRIKKSSSMPTVPPFTPSETGQVLARLRAKEPKLTMRELAQLTGISPGYVSKLLKRKRERCAVTVSGA